MPHELDTDTPTRILLLAESPYFGGITTHLLSILDAFRDSAQFEFLIATFPPKHKDTTLIDEARTRGVVVRVFAMSHTWDLRVLRALRRFVTKQNVALIHTHNYRATLLCALAAPGVPVINTFHGMMVESSWRLRFWQWLELIAMRRHRLTIACSEYLRRELLAQGLSPKQLRVVYNSCSPAAPDAEAVTRASLGVSEDSLVVLFVGRLVEGKGVETLIDAVTRRAGWALVVAGDGPLRNALERHARDLNAPVYFAGFVAQPEPLYRLADVVALVSQMEALPTVLLEAAAYGKPVIASRVGGVPEIIEDGVSGVLVDPGDVEALGDALEQLRDGGVRRALGNAARTVWSERFSKYHMAKALGLVYEEALRR